MASLSAVRRSLRLWARPPRRQKEGDRASAYYHYTLGHMYAEQAGNKGDFLNKAIENFRLALKADPGASFISEELSDLYVQSGRLREAVQDAEETLRAIPRTPTRDVFSAASTRV